MLRDVSIPLQDGSNRLGVLSLPLPETGAVPHPGVVIIHDIYGFRRDTRRYCQRFAKAGSGDNLATSRYASESLSSGDLGGSDASSIPAASTISTHRISHLRGRFPPGGTR